MPVNRAINASNPAMVDWRRGSPKLKWLEEVKNDLNRTRIREWEKKIEERIKNMESDIRDIQKGNQSPRNGS